MRQRWPNGVPMVRDVFDGYECVIVGFEPGWMVRVNDCFGSETWTWPGYLEPLNDDGRTMLAIIDEARR